jgi:hypothetical protein
MQAAVELVAKLPLEQRGEVVKAAAVMVLKK